MLVRLAVGTPHTLHLAGAHALLFFDYAFSYTVVFPHIRNLAYKLLGHTRP
jgi:hypothetical protein